MKNASLSIAQKQQICDERASRDRQGSPASLEALSQWAKHQFGLPSKPNRSTISRILRIPPPRLQSTAHKFRMRRGKDDQLEKALFDWVCECREKRIHITSAMIKSKAFRLCELRDEALPAEQKNTMKFSDGWVAAFKKRWGLSQFRPRSEGGDGDGRSANRDMSNIQSKINHFDRKNVFSAVEFDLSYRKAPAITVAPSRISGRKVAKERMSVLACANADGSEKIELMIIGTARCPRPFKKKSGADLGFDYHANEKASMTSPLFFEWLHRFDKYIGRSDERKVLLLIGSCPEHGTADDIPALQHVEVLFLPSNTTSKLQPMDVGVIEALKMRYKSFQMDRALGFVDSNCQDMFKVNILEAMRALKRLWNALPPDLISNCWSYTSPIEPESASARVAIDRLLATESDIISNQLQELLPRSNTISVEALCNNPDEQDVIQDVNDDVLAENRMEEEDAADGCDDEMPHPTPLPSIEEQLKTIATMKRIVDSQNVPDDVLRDRLVQLQTCLRREHAAQCSQQPRSQGFLM